MEVQPYVEQLLAFEQQRLGVNVRLADACPARTDGIVVAPPALGTVSTPHEITLADGSVRSVPLATLPDGDFASVSGPFGLVTVAATVGSTLHLAFDPSAIVSAGHRSTLAQLWDVAVSPALTALAEQARTAAEREQREAFVRIEEQVWRETLRRLPLEIDNLEYTVSRSESQLREQLTKLDDLRRQHRALQIALAEGVRQSAQAQHEALRRLVPGTYSSIELKDSRIVGVIGPIVLEDDDGEVEVGTFEVSLVLDTAQVEIRNTTNVVNGIHHPHVRGPQDLCLGNIRTAVTRLVAEREWASLLVVIARFLNSYTENDVYQKLSAWSPDRSDDDDDEYDGDDEDADDESVECSICLEQVASDDITHVQDQPVCLACYDRDTIACGGCSTRTLSRNIARESMRCRTCVPAAAALAVQEVAS